MSQTELGAIAAHKIEVFIAELERNGRNPDRYECDWLIRAIVWFDEGRFDDCLADMARAAARGADRDVRKGGVLHDSMPLTAGEFRACWGERKRAARTLGRDNAHPNAQAGGSQQSDGRTVSAGRRP